MEIGILIACLACLPIVALLFTIVMIEARGTSRRLAKRTAQADVLTAKLAKWQATGAGQTSAASEKANRAIPARLRQAGEGSL